MSHGFGNKKKETPLPSSPAPVLREIRAKEAQERMAQGALLLDVREDIELTMSAVKGARHIPMGQVPERLSELPKEAEIVCMCHHGQRSAGVAGFLREQGYMNVASLAGGIAAWAAEVDPSVGQY